MDKHPNSSCFQILSTITYMSGKGYGIALKPGSGLKNALDTGILKMMEGGDLYKV